MIYDTLSTLLTYTEGVEVRRDILCVVVDPSVKSIKNRAFHDCRRLISIKLTSSITTIGGAAFANCSSLTSIKLPPSISNIEKEAFSGCTSLISIEIPPTVSIIQKMTFMECTSLKTVLIPNSVTSIEYGAFAMCTNLVHVKLPPSITDISSFSFAYCKNLISIEASIINPNTVSIILVKKNPASIVEALEKASFFPFKLKDVLDGKCDRIDPDGTYFDWKVYARIKDKHGRFPLVTAAERSLKWSSWLGRIFKVYMPAIEYTDEVTGFEPFMLAAVGSKSDLEAVYELLRLNPAAIISR